MKCKEHGIKKQFSRKLRKWLCSECLAIKFTEGRDRILFMGTNQTDGKEWVKGLLDKEEES